MVYRLQKQRDGTCKVFGKSSTIAVGNTDYHKYVSYCDLHLGFGIMGMGKYHMVSPECQAPEDEMHQVICDGY